MYLFKVFAQNEKAKSTRALQNEITLRLPRLITGYQKRRLP